MIPSPRIDDALETLLSEMAEAVAWTREVEGELARARERADALATSIRATIETQPHADRAAWADRLRKLLGGRGKHQLNPHKSTPRSRAALRWLARHPQADFHSIELRKYLLAQGFSLCASIMAASTSNWCKRGILTRKGPGWFHINRDHQALAGLG